MNYPILVQPLPTVRCNGKQNVTAFRLDLGQISFGYLYLNPQHNTYTLSWRGAHTFGSLDGTAQSFFQNQLELLNCVNFSSRSSRIRVALILVDKLLKLNLRNPDDECKYQTLLKRPEQISFARYDFYVRAIGFTCSFTAENAQSLMGNVGELATVLPRSHGFSEGFLRWVMEQHADSELLSETLDVNSSVATLTDLLHHPTSLSREVLHR
jgi:hypothetical protein